MPSEQSYNAEQHLLNIAQLPTVDEKLDVIVKALTEIILAVQNLESENLG